MARLRTLLQELGTAGTTADAVYRVLRRSIINGDLPPGERLRSDALANKIKVSRTPVREALRKLESEGLVTQSGRTGLVVRELTETDLTEVFYVREALEGMAARLAAQNATPSEIAELRELLEDMEAVSGRGDVSVLRDLTGEFHKLVCRASHNNRLLLSLTALLDHVRQDQFSTLYVGGRPAEAIKEHQTLLMAIETHDAEGAERAAREHRRKTLELRKDMRREQLRKIRSEGEKPSEPQSRAD
jgi:DNA-binding GntR family transcriptional regulator